MREVECWVSFCGRRWYGWGEEVAQLDWERLEVEGRRIVGGFGFESGEVGEVGTAEVLPEWGWSWEGGDG
jgi:hypothetical protein